VTPSHAAVGLGRPWGARADDAGVKVHLIRRSSRRAALVQRSCFLIDMARGWVERHELGEPAEVLELDLGAMRDLANSWID
jgi:hypothetical protein